MKPAFYEHRLHALRPHRCSTATRLRLYARARKGRASLHSAKRREQPVTVLATGYVYASATQRRRQNCFYAFATHTTGAHRFAEPVVSHKNEFCLLRPPGARCLALRLSTPLGFGPLRGRARWSGLRRLAPLARLPALRGRRCRGVDLPAQRCCAAGCCCLRNNPRNPPRPDRPARRAPAEPSRAVLRRPTTMRTRRKSAA